MDNMLEASKYFLGTHDFYAFMASNAEVKSTIRTIYKISIERNEDFIEFIIEGNSFLRNMVRIIVGTLIGVGQGKIKKEDIPKIILDRKREYTGHTAPPQGLFLEKVFY